MNVRNHLVEIQCGHKDVTDVAQAIIHSLIFFRTHGKFNYKHEESYSIGTLGFETATCDHLDFSYIRCSSHSLVNKINNKLQELIDKLNENTNFVNLALEFYTKRPSRWPFNDSKIVWELWNLKIVINWNLQPLSLVTSPSDHHHYQQRYSDQTTTPTTSIRIEDVLSHKLLDIIRIVNSDKCSLPQMPTQPNLDSVFDTSHAEVQPYLYNISYKITENIIGPHNTGGGSNTKFADGNIVTDSSTQSTLKKFLLGTLEL